MLLKPLSRRKRLHARAAPVDRMRIHGPPRTERRKVLESGLEKNFVLTRLEVDRSPRQVERIALAEVAIEARLDGVYDGKALEAACRVLDHLMTQVGPGLTDIVATGNYVGMPSTSVLEPVMYLYNRTRNPRYLDFAEYIGSDAACIWDMETYRVIYDLYHPGNNGMDKRDWFVLYRYWFPPEFWWRKEE